MRECVSITAGIHPRSDRLVVECDLPCARLGFLQPLRTRTANVGDVRSHMRDRFGKDFLSDSIRVEGYAEQAQKQTPRHTVHLMEVSTEEGRAGLDVPLRVRETRSNPDGDNDL